MSILTTSYFKGIIQLANVTDVAPGNSGSNNLLENYILKYESEFLIKILGFDLYSQLKEDLTTDANGVTSLNENAATKWNDLLYGKTYELNGKKVFYRGLFWSDSNNTDAQKDRSPIANYVYCHYTHDTELSHSGVGFQKEKPKNSTVLSFRTKAVNSWNEMVDNLMLSEKGMISLKDFIQDMNSLEADTYSNFYPYNVEYANRYTLWKGL